MKTFAIVTPTYNREFFLPRLYQSILAQEFPFSEFTWIVVDDGSTDNTKQLINSLSLVSPFEIIYLYKPNGGKHSAWRYVVNYLNPKDFKYFVSIDSDDELTSDALCVFNQHWIELEGNNDIGLINARTMVYGGKDNPHEIFAEDQCIDDTYQNVTIKMGEQSEMITSIRVKELHKYLDIPTDFWLRDKVKFFSENILWARAGRLTKTRYLKNVLRIVHCDATNQVSHNRDKKSTNHLYNYIVGIKYFYIENLDYISKYQKAQMLIDIAKFGAMCMIVGIDFKTTILELKVPILRLLVVVMWPLSLFLVICFYLKRYI